MSQLRLIAYISCIGLLLIYVFVIPGIYYDDGYIFLVYAQNLAQGKGLCFNEGIRSLGVSNILWTFLLAVAVKILPLAAEKSAIFLTLIFYAATAFLWEKMITRVFKRAGLGLAVAVAFMLFPGGHRMMLSGMDTIFHTFLLSLFLYLGFRYGLKTPVLLGISGGLILLSRVEAIFFLLSLVAYLLIKEGKNRRLLINGVIALLIAGLMLLPYIFYLYREFGIFTPPTRIGKLMTILPAQHPQYDFTSWLQTSIITRILFVSKNFLISFFNPFVEKFHTLLGFLTVILLILRLIQKLRISAIFWVLYCALLLQFLLYAIYFPLLKYRYFFFLTPVNIAFCIITINDLGWVDYLERLKKPGLAITVFILMLIIYGLVFVKTIKVSLDWDRVADVARQTGKWLNQHTPTSARVAIELIGAVKYFSNRYIIDFGGLTDVRLWKYLKRGFKETESIYKCLEEARADYVLDWEDKIYLGQTIDRFPSKFELMNEIKPYGDLRASSWVDGLLVYRFTANN